MSRTIAIGMLATTLLAAASALAGPADGNRPGPAPAPWMLPRFAEPPAYALTGKPERGRPVDEGPWVHQAERLGSKVVVDIYRR